MTHDQLPLNVMSLTFTYNEDDGDMGIHSAHNIDEKMDEESRQFLLDVFNGMYLSFESMIQQYALIGQITRYAAELEEELSMQDEELTFEPDDEFLQAIADAKVIPFDKKKMN